MMVDKITEFAEINNLRFNNLELLRRALTHSSFAYENKHQALKDNERLEFLGDAVLELAISEVLYKENPSLDEGKMTRLRALIVREETLAQVGFDLKIGEYLRLGYGEMISGGKVNPSNISNAVEALFGAYFLDQNYVVVSEFIVNSLNKYIKLALSGNLIYDFKSQLLELVQKSNDKIHFQLTNTRGPSHAPVFTVAIRYHDEIIATGEGTSKKQAEQEASKQALVILQR